MLVKILKRAAVIGATAVALMAAPFAASGIAESSAPAPVRAAASAVAVPSAEAAYPYQCKWKWQRLPGPWWTNNYGWVRVCYQIPN